MTTPIKNSLSFPTAKQIPDHAIMDINGKQCYLGNQFAASSGIVSLADNAEHPLLFHKNAATNLVSFFVFCLEMQCCDVSGATSVTFKFYLNPTGVSGGTAGTASNCRFASNNASVSTILISPTVSANGTLFATYSSGWENIAQINWMKIIDPGIATLITATGSAATTALINKVWNEI